MMAHDQLKGVFSILNEAAKASGVIVEPFEIKVQEAPDGETGLHFIIITLAGRDADIFLRGAGPTMAHAVQQIQAKLFALANGGKDAA